MVHYRSNLRDTEFVLFDVLRVQDAWSKENGEAMTQDAAEALLRAIDKWAAEVLAPAFADSDHGDATLDPTTGRVHLAPAVRDVVRRQMRSDWPLLDLPTDLSDQHVPASLRWAVAEFIMGANPAVSMITSVTPMALGMLHKFGTPTQKRLAEVAVERGWTTTMAITEADAGSDVAAIRTKAVPREDGSWAVTGTKRFITYGDHDGADNVLHFVLARPVVDGEQVGGSRGLALFVIPAVLTDKDGTLGERNGVQVTALAHKMGLHATPTCEMSFGDAAPAIGWPLGGVTSGGLGQMFDLLKQVRMLVAVKTLAALS